MCAYVQECTNHKPQRTNTLTDVVVQDGYQSVLNLRTVLNQISARHPRIKTCSRETDGAGSYNSIFVALFTLQLGQGGQSGTIKVIQHGHNEPGHGSDICDTAGTRTLTHENTHTTQPQPHPTRDRSKLHKRVLATYEKDGSLDHFCLSYEEMSLRSPDGRLHTSVSSGACVVGRV